MFQKETEIDELNAVIEAAVKNSNKQKKPVSPFTSAISPSLNQPYSEKAVLDYIKSRPDFGETPENKDVVGKEELDSAIEKMSKMLRVIRKTNPANAVDLARQLAPYYFSRGSRHVQAGDFKRAIRDFSDTIRLDPNHAGAYECRGMIYGLKKLLDEAMADFKKTIALEPDNATGYYNRGIVYGVKGALDEAMADYNKAIELKKDYANAYCGRGCVYAKKRDYDAALADYNKAIEIKKDDAETYMFRGQAHAAQEDYSKALADFSRAINLEPESPNNVEAYNGRGRAYAEIEEFDKAIADHTKSLALNSTYVSGYLNRGIAYGEKKMFNEALADFTKAIELEPNGESGYHNRAVTYEKMGALDAAIEDYTEALTIKPLAVPYCCRGRVFAAKKMMDAALADYAKSIALKPTYANPYYYRAHAYKELARMDMEKAVELDPVFVADEDDELRRRFKAERRQVDSAEKGLFGEARATLKKSLKKVKTWLRVAGIRLTKSMIKLLGKSSARSAAKTTVKRDAKSRAAPSGPLNNIGGKS